MQRVVSRSELEAERSSPEGSVGSDLLENANVLHDFEFVDKRLKTEEDIPSDPQRVDEDGEDELAFNLFAPSGPNSNSTGDPSATQRIRIRSPSIDPDRPAGFIQPDRDPSYYFTDTPGVRSGDTFTSSALTGDDILARSKSPWPGSTYDWKVLHIPPPTQQQNKGVLASTPSLFSKLIDSQTVSGGKRTRPGKKYRIRIRMRRAAVLQKEAIKAAEEAKEAEYREKKTRRNREKKVKKRMRDKAKKMAEGEGNARSDGDGREEGSGND